MNAPHRSLLLAVCLISAAGPALAQTGGGHILFGDLHVDERGVTGPKPQYYHVALTGVGAVPLSRQPIANHGRYRFLDVSNGDYDLIVEVEGQEVARITIRIDERVKTDIRRDLNLEWRPTVASKPAGKAAGPPVVDAYSRPSETGALYTKAQDEMRKRDFARASSLLDQIVKADPKDFEAWTELGTARFMQNKMGDAEKAYSRALEGRPSYLLALLNLGKVRMAQKNYDGAIEVLTRAVELHPESADVQFFLGESYLQVKKGSKAVVHLNEALRLDPVGKAEAHLRLGALYNAAGMKSKAAAEYEQFIAKKPDHPDRKKLEKYISENK